MEKRQVYMGTVEYAAGQKKTFEVQRDGVLLQLNLRARYTVTAGTNAMVGAKYQTIARILRRVEVKIGNDTIVSQSGEELAARALYESGVVPDGMEDAFVLTGSATVTAYDVTIPLPFYLPRSADPFATAADLRGQTQVTLEVTWANGAADLVTTVESAALSAVTLDLEGIYALLGPNDAWAKRTFLIRELSSIQKDFTASSTAMGITIDGKTNVAVRSVGIAMLDGLVGTNADLNTLRIESGAFKWQELRAGAIQAENKRAYAVGILTGWYYVPFVFGGMDAMAINTSPNVLTADLQAVFDVNSATAGQVLMSVEKVRPLNR